jgi:hypothetical protein
MSKTYYIQLPKGSVDHIVRWERNGGKKAEDRVELRTEYRNWGVILTVQDGEEFDVEKVKKNENGEWREYDWEDSDEGDGIAHIAFEAEDDRYETIFHDEGEGEMEEALEADGFEETYCETEYDSGDGRELGIEEMAS